MKLDLRTESAVSQAYDEILRNAMVHKPDAKIEGVLVTRTSRAALSWCLVSSITPIWMRRHVWLGRDLVGTGQDVASSLPGLNAEQAEGMIDRTRAGKLLFNFVARRPTTARLVSRS